MPWLAILASLLCGGLAIPRLMADTSARVHGSITDKDTGRPIPGANVVINDMVGNTLSSTSSDSAGSYTFTVPQEPAYAISVSSWMNNGAYYVSNYVIGSAVGIPGGVADIRTDFALRPGANLILEAYAADGTMLRRAAFFNAVNNQAYATDLNDVPNFGISTDVYDAYAQNHNWSNELTVPAFVVPLKTPTRLQGFRMLGAVAYWASGDSFVGDSACPDYWRQMTFEQMKANVHDHMSALAGTYGSQIAPWMISEQNIQNCLGLTWPQKMQVHDAFMDGLHAGFPGAQNIVTAVAMPYGWQQDPFDNSPGVAGGISLPVYLNMLVSGNHALDTIGLEFYHFGVATVPPYNAPPGWSLAAMARNLDFYAQYGVPIYVEEFQVPSTQEPSSSWWHRPWDPQTQAEFAEKFYTLAFSRPSVQDIQWSTELSDRNSFIKNAGLFDANYQPKPVFYGLRDLIQSWTTSGSTTTDAQGQADIVGFAGDYLLQVAAPGDVAPDIKTHVYEQKDIAQTIAYQGLPAVVVVSAASFVPGPVAPDSIAAIFGTRLATGVAQAESALLPGSLLGTTVQIRDSKGVAYAAALFSVSPGQVNVLIPANVAAGQATLTILSGDGTSQSSTLQIQTVAPGIFQLNGDGLAAAQVLRINAAGERTLEPVFQVQGGQVVAAPIDLGPPTDQLFLSLYGTGLRNRSALSSVQVTIGGLSTQALYAGPQGSPGLDQINVALDRALAGRGVVNVSVVADGRASNVTRLLVQ